LSLAFFYNALGFPFSFPQGVWHVFPQVAVDRVILYNTYTLNCYTSPHNSVRKETGTTLQPQPRLNLTASVTLSIIRHTLVK